jgi:hypothetical protein
VGPSFTYVLKLPDFRNKALVHRSPLLFYQYT